MKVKKIKGTVRFWNWVGDHVEGLDLNATLRLPQTSFKVGEDVYRAPHWNGMFQNLAKFLDLSVEDCRFRIGHSYSLAFKEELPEKVIKVVKEDVVQEEVKEETVETEEIQEVEVPEVVEETTDDVEVDWNWVEGLTNTKDDKAALDEYAEAKFGIKLKRNMKIENMIKIFKEELEA